MPPNSLNSNESEFVYNPVYMYELQHPLAHGPSITRNHHEYGTESIVQLKVGRNIKCKITSQRTLPYQGYTYNNPAFGCLLILL